MLFSKFHSLGFHNTWKQQHNQENFPSGFFLGFRVFVDILPRKETGSGGNTRDLVTTKGTGWDHQLPCQLPIIVEISSILVMSREA
jgi:hypothetical protein